MARKIKFEIAKFDKITPGGQALGESYQMKPQKFKLQKVNRVL